MNKKLTRNEVFWGYSARLLNIAGGLILLPLVVHYLPQEEVGLWFVFLALVSLAQLLDFGLEPTIARNASYVYSGAQNLHEKGIEFEVKIGSIDSTLLADLLASSRNIYRMIGISAAILLLGLGTIYVLSLLPADYHYLNPLVGWIAFCLGYIVNFYYGYFNGLLQGRGDITYANKTIVASRSILVLLGALGLVLGWGLVGLGFASLFSCLASRFFSYYYFFTTKRPETEQLRKMKGNVKRLTKVLYTNAWRMGLVNLGAFLILRSNLLIASSFLGLRMAASYGLTLQILFAMSGMSSMLANLQLPYMNAFQVHNQFDRLRCSFGMTLISSCGLYLLGGLIIVFTGNDILQLIGSNTLLLPTAELSVLFFIGFLEMNHTISASYLTTLNYIPFVKAALFSGVSILFLSLILISFTDVKIWALLFSQGIVQASYNNWKWPKEALKHLDCNFEDLIYFGFKELRSLARGKYD